MRCPTVRVKDANAPGGFVVINESDLTDQHEVVQPEAIHPENVVKPFVQPEPVQTISQPIGQPTVFDHTADAPFNRQASLAPGQTAVILGGSQTDEDYSLLTNLVEIPRDWESLQWKKQVKLARSLGLNDVSSIHKAKEFIRSKVAERGGK